MPYLYKSLKMEKEIKLKAYKPDEFLDMKEIETAKIKNCWNYKDEYFILEIGNKKYMFRKDEFKIAIDDATNY